jgi:Fe-S cluster assembly scaffold protein SufB
MTQQAELLNRLYDSIGPSAHALRDDNTASLVVHQNRVIGLHGVGGLSIDVDELDDGIEAAIDLAAGTVIDKPVHLCFGMYPETGVQRIILDVRVRENSRISLLAHCVFPKAIDVEHIMDARIRVEDGAEYSYLEKHIHSPSGGVRVYPKAVVEVGTDALFKTEFELIRGRVGLIDVDYRTGCGARSVIEMLARVSGKEDDQIKIKEVAHLKGEHARGALTSKIAVRDRARAEIYNELTASAAYARGHVDCKEIVQSEAVATAVPVVEVHHPKAHVTHEAAIGSVDGKQLETLMSRGLSEDDAVELIISGLLSR